uniref:PDZ domain-containing protein n=1 Tax=Anisakis simplex TaxID=6269 RepID=A0A0M3JXY8_ANISI
LGVTIENGVIAVSKLVEASVAEGVLHEGDIIVTINGDAPKSKEDTRSMLVKALKNTGQATLKVSCIFDAERNSDEPSVMLNSDVLEIAKQQQERLLNAKPELEQAAPRGILGHYTQLSEAKEQKRLNVEQDHQSLMIGMDPVDHPLMHVKSDPNQNQQDNSHSDSQKTI